MSDPVKRIKEIVDNAKKLYSGDSKHHSDVKWVVSYGQDDGDFIVVWPYDRDHLGHKLRSILERNNIKENIRQKIMISINEIYLRVKNPRYIHITEGFYVYNKPGIEVKSNVQTRRKNKRNSKKS